jgi:D-alanine transaminase
MSVVYLNGEFVPADEAMISVNDRGFLLSDGLYEVTPAYDGRFFRMDRHMARLERGLSELRIALDPAKAGIRDVHERLMDENGLRAADMSIVYLQVTRGVAPRSHWFPKDPVQPTVYAFAKAILRPDRDRWLQGFEAVTVPDRRWARRDIKSIALLPNVLAMQAAVDHGVTDALLVSEGVAIEGGHANFFAVFGDTIATHPTSNRILHGVTRAYVLEIARELGFHVEERAVQVEELQHATETFFTGTTAEVRPTVRIDGRNIGDGAVGPVARRLYEAFLEGVGQRF